MNDALRQVSPFRILPRAEWAELRKDTPLTLTAAELEELRGFNDRIDLDEVVAIYLPLSRLLNLYVAATQELFRATQRFLGGNGHKVPYVVGIGGSVAAGKSTSARILQRLLARWPNHPKVDLVTTDGFLKTNAALEREGLMNRKGFPESYDFAAILRFLSAIKAGMASVPAPVYSHLAYDVRPGESIEIDGPDILIVEGINVLQTGRPPRDGKIIPNVSDYFDFSIYLDADEEALRTWYVERFLSLRETAFRDPLSYFHRYASLGDEDARDTANRIWETINLVNLHDNVIPTRQRADLILRKGGDHVIDAVWLRKL